jgi:HPt (histidine-containing phosphotransfer) domain-containing protein
LNALPEPERREGPRDAADRCRRSAQHRALARPALLNSMIELYMTHSPALMARSKAPSQTAGRETLSEALHTFKSSTANLGGVRLAIAARECEAKVRDGGIAEAAPFVPKIRGNIKNFAPRCCRSGRRMQPNNEVR